METLYCFKLNEDKAIIEIFEIKEYSIIYYCNKEHYVFKHKLGGNHDCKHYIPITNIDKLVNFKVYSFDSSLENAISHITSSLVEKRTKAYNEYERWNKLIIHLNDTKK